MAINSKRRAISHMVYGALPPHSTNVLWMDTSVPELPVCKIFWNGCWTSVHTDDSKEIALLIKVIGELSATTESQENTIAQLSEQILAAIQAIDLSEVAKEDNATTNKEAIISAISTAKTELQGGDTTATLLALKTAIDNIDIDTTTIAKQGTNSSATLTDTQAAVVDGNDTSVSVAKEVRSEIGTGSDTAAETGTLFAIVKWVKDKVKSISQLIGTPATGQPSDLFAAIGALGADQLKVQECYNVAEEKYATMPEYRTIENLPATIETINATRLSEIPVSALTIYSAQTIVDYKGILFYSFPNNTGAIEVYNLKGSGGLADKGVASVTKIQFADWTGNPNYFRCNNLNWVDATGFHMPANGDLGAFTTNPHLLRTLIGDHTLEEVLDGLAVFDGTATSQAFLQNATALRREDFRAMINGLADLTGQTAQTLTIGYNNLRKLTADDIAVATAKNWTLA